MIALTNDGGYVSEIYYQKIPSFIKSANIDGKNVRVVVVVVYKKNRLEKKYRFFRKENLLNFLKELGIKIKLEDYLKREELREATEQLSENNIEFWQFLEGVAQGIGGSIFKKKELQKKIDDFQEMKAQQLQL